MDTSEVQDRNLDCILEKFQKECDDSLNIYFQSLRLYNEHSDLFSETMRNMMVEYVVMQLFFKNGKKFFRRGIYRVYVRRM